MKITNKMRLPQALLAAVKNDAYSKGDADFSTTQLYVPSRIIALRAKHEDEIEEDVADMIYALLGKLGHAILEQAGTTEYIEKRLFWTMPDGTKISGCMDIVDGTTIEDWKFTSIWSAKKGVKPDWIAQASVNAYLCLKNNIKITNARYIAIYRDWSAPQVKRSNEYPAHQVEAFGVPLWHAAQTEEWIMERIASHKAAMKRLPECTDEDRWAKGSGFAVMKKGRKTAVKLFETESGAMAFISEQTDATVLSVEPRAGVNTRCEFYCSCAPFCSQAKALGVDTGAVDPNEELF